MLFHSVSIELMALGMATGVAAELGNFTFLESVDPFGSGNSELYSVRE